jgi:YesN/AraC family two-component response regulator
MLEGELKTVKEELKAVKGELKRERAQGQPARDSGTTSRGGNDDKGRVDTVDTTDQNSSSVSVSKENVEDKGMLQTLRVLQEELCESQRALEDAIRKSEANEPMLKRLMGEGLQLRKLLGFKEEVHVTLKHHNCYCLKP